MKERWQRCPICNGKGWEYNIFNHNEINNTCLLKQQSCNCCKGTGHYR